MYSFTLFLAFSQLVALAVATGEAGSLNLMRRDGGYQSTTTPFASSSKWTTVTRSSTKPSTIASTKKTTTTPVKPSTTPSTKPTSTITRSSTTTTTASPTPSCPETFKLLLNPGSFQYFVQVDNALPWGTTTSQQNATIFSIQSYHDTNRLVPASVGGSYASVAEDTGANGNPIISTINEDQFLVATFDYYCALHLTKQISPTVTLDTVYALNINPQELYIQPASHPAPSGAKQVPLIALAANYDTSQPCFGNCPCDQNPKCPK